MISMINCPVCRAAEQTGPQCRRCRADLSLLVGLETRRSELMARARHLVQQKDWHRAVDIVEEANSLRQDFESQQTLAVLAVLRHDYRRALAIHRQLRHST